MMVLGIATAPMHAVSADVVNGWSQSATITKIHSLGSATLFKLSVGSETCGHPDFWSLPLEDTARGRAKLSILLAAYTAGKTVTLRCENSAVTDFEVVN
jgi:hypothetical protein